VALVPRHALAAVASGLIVAATSAGADVWKRVDERGVVHLSNRHLGPGSVRILRSRRPRGAAATMEKRRARYAPLIEGAARRYGLNPELVHAVVRAESAYDPGAVSAAGAVGLMQLMPATAARYGVRDRRDPAANLAGGVRYLRDLLLQFRKVPLALAAYNAGENAVLRHGNRIPPFPETRAYVRRVIGYYQAQSKRS
jgi:soluble lytic murein transglycosylase-like protein